MNATVAEPVLTFRSAQPGDVAAIVALVESAYRGDVSRKGWTTEADFLDGQRTDPAGVAELVGKPHNRILLVLRDGKLLACCHLEQQGDACYFGMFAVEEKASGDYVGRVGPWYPPGWPGFEVGWAITPDRQGRGYAIEAARGAIDWVFANFTVDRIIHCIDAANAPSQGVARRLGAENEGPGQLNDHVVDIWVTVRDRWRNAS